MIRFIRKRKRQIVLALLILNGLAIGRLVKQELTPNPDLIEYQVPQVERDLAELKRHLPIGSYGIIVSEADYIFLSVAQYALAPRLLLKGPGPDILILYGTARNDIPNGYRVFGETKGNFLLARRAGS